MTEISAGVVLIENDKVLLVKQLNNTYSFPKGNLEGKETKEEAAIRETKEETSLDVEIISKKEYNISYYLENNNLKKCTYFIGRITGGNIKKQEEEIEKVLWVNINEIDKYLKYENIIKLFKSILEDIKN